MREVITGDFIKTAVANKIEETFPNTKIYKEEQLQGMKTPCFFVLEVDVEHVKGLGNISNRTHSIVARYIPDDNSNIKYEDCASIGNVLSDILELINTEQALSRGSEMHYEIIDDILYFYVNYAVRILKEKEPDPKMEEMALKENIKEDNKEA